MIRIKFWNSTKTVRPADNAVWIKGYGWVEGCWAEEVQPGMIWVREGGSYDVVRYAESNNRSSTYITVMYDPKNPACLRTYTRWGLVPCQWSIEWAEVSTAPFGWICGDQDDPKVRSIDFTSRFGVKEAMARYRQDYRQEPKCIRVNPAGYRSILEFCSVGHQHQVQDVTHLYNLRVLGLTSDQITE